MFKAIAISCLSHITTSTSTPHSPRLFDWAGWVGHKWVNWWLENILVFGCLLRVYKIKPTCHTHTRNTTAHTNDFERISGFASLLFFLSFLRFLLACYCFCFVTRTRTYFVIDRGIQCCARQNKENVTKCKTRQLKGGPNVLFF